MAAWLGSIINVSTFRPGEIGAFFCVISGTNEEWTFPSMSRDRLESHKLIFLYASKKSGRSYTLPAR
jgi:hypothetical protein